MTLQNNISTQRLGKPRGRPKDETGKVYGRLTVLRAAPNKEKKDGRMLQGLQSG